jgi:hypothetical protein
LERDNESKPVTEAPLFDWRKHLKVHPAAELFPPLSPEELQALADDIKINGLRTKIVIWCPDVNVQNEALLDGRNRLDALAMLGLLCADDSGSLAFTKAWGGNKWLEAPGRQLGHDYNLGGDPYALALSYNVHRRHLTAEQKRELIAKVLKAKPEQSNRVIAEQIKADDKTVARVRRTLESTAEIPQLKKTVGADGKTRKSEPAKSKSTKSTETIKPAAPTETTKSTAPAETTKSTAKPVSTEDAALFGFTASVLELVRRIGHHDPKRFSKSAVPAADLMRLGKFLIALAELKAAASAESKSAVVIH